MFTHLPDDPNPKKNKTPKSPAEKNLMQNILNLFRNFMFLLAMSYLIFISYENQIIILIYLFSILIIATIIHTTSQIKYQNKIELKVKELNPEKPDEDEDYLIATPSQIKNLTKELIIIGFATLIISLIIPNL